MYIYIYIYISLYIYIYSTLSTLYVYRLSGTQGCMVVSTTRGGDVS